MILPNKSSLSVVFFPWNLPQMSLTETLRSLTAMHSYPAFVDHVPGISQFNLLQ